MCVLMYAYGSWRRRLRTARLAWARAHACWRRGGCTALYILRYRVSMTLKVVVAVLLTSLASDAATTRVRINNDDLTKHQHLKSNDDGSLTEIAVQVRLCGCTEGARGQLWDIGGTPTGAATPWRPHGGNASNVAAVVASVSSLEPRQCVDAVLPPSRPGAALLRLVRCGATTRNFSLVAALPGGGGPRVITSNSQSPLAATQQFCVDANYGGPELQLWHCNHVVQGAQDFKLLVSALSISSCWLDTAFVCLCV